MVKRVLSVLMILCMISVFCVNVGADGDVIRCSNIIYTDADGNPVTELSLQPVIAKVNITENTSGKAPVLIVCSYESGMLSGVWHSTETVLTGEISVSFTLNELTENTVVETTVLESLHTLKSLTSSARLSENSLGISVLRIGGEVMEEYSDEVDVYKKHVSSDFASGLEIIPDDSGTKVEITDASSVPGVAKVRLTSPSGMDRNISIVLYSDVAQLSKPSGIGYRIGDTSYEIADFNTDTTKYTVELPDNTFYVTLEPEVLDITDVSVKVLDVDHSTKTYDGIGYTGGTLHNLYKTLFNPRPAVNNVIPIKNEETKAVVYTGYGDETSTYTITFVSKQPRLTSFNIADGVKELDTYYPIFMGGAAANNDNGSAAGTDRAWSVTNIPDRLIGSSMFTTLLRNNDKGQAENNWYESNKNGEYFNFTADTGGTLYIMSRDKITNSEYAVESTPFDADGKWRLIGNVSSNYLPEGYTDWKEVPRTFGSYGDDVYYLRVIQYQGKERFEDGALTANTGLLANSGYNLTYARSFEAGEEVSVFHPGISNSIIVFVKWNLQ